MKKIQLTKGFTALVDDDDFERVSAKKWTAHTANNKVYAAHWFRKDGQKGMILLHRFIMNAPDGKQIDHQDGDGLNCGKANLRYATQAQNCQNRRPSQTAAVRFKGVCVDKKAQGAKNQFRARIFFNNKQHHLGNFPTAEQAAAAYDRKAKEHFGEFAYLNFK